MARGRKSTKIKAIKMTERDALKCLWRTGVATKEQIKENFGLHGERLQKMANSGYLTINKDIVSLNRIGEKYCEKELGMQYRYKSAANHLSHDLKLTFAYLRLEPKERESWKSEPELRALVKEMKGFEDFQKEMIKHHGTYKATPDAAILDPVSGEYVGFECVTSNYSESDIQQKTEFCNRFLSGIYKF